MKVYRLPYGRVFHRLEYTPDPGDPPFAACNIHYGWNEFWVCSELKDVPRKDVCRRCFPSPAKRITHVEILESRLKEALDGWAEEARANRQSATLRRVDAIREEIFG